MTPWVPARLCSESARELAIDDVTLRVLRAVTAFIKRGEAIEYVPVVTLEIERAGDRHRVELTPGNVTAAAGCQLRLDGMTDVPFGDGEQSQIDVSLLR